LEAHTVIPATWEIEIRRIVVQDHLWQKVRETSIAISQLGLVVHWWYTLVIPVKWEVLGRRIMV
jgi:hypothetical protein